MLVNLPTVSAHLNIFFPLSSTHNVMVVPLMGALDSSNLDVATIVFNVSFCLFVFLFSFNVVAYTL